MESHGASGGITEYERVCSTSSNRSEDRKKRKRKNEKLTGVVAEMSRRNKSEDSPAQFYFFTDRRKWIWKLCMRRKLFLVYDLKSNTFHFWKRLNSSYVDWKLLCISNSLINFVRHIHVFSWVFNTVCNFLCYLCQLSFIIYAPLLFSIFYRLVTFTIMHNSWRLWNAALWKWFCLSYLGNCMRTRKHR